MAAEENTFVVIVSILCSNTLPVMNRCCLIDTIVNTDDGHGAGDWLISNNLYTDESSKH